MIVVSEWMGTYFPKLLVCFLSHVQLEILITDHAAQCLQVIGILVNSPNEKTTEAQIICEIYLLLESIRIIL